MKVLCQFYSLPQLTQIAINGSGVRDTARVLHISRNTVSSQLKKKASAPAARR